MDMSDRIKERRIAVGYTQEELGKRLGLQKSAIAKYENGRVENIKRSIISKMADILECSPSYLMGWSNNIQNNPTNQQLSNKEQRLLNDFRNLNTQGQEYILQTMDMVKEKYKKIDCISKLENIDAG